MHRSKLILMFVTFLALLTTWFQIGRQTHAEDDLLQGPILLTQVGARITFEDVGTGRVWGLETHTPLYTLGPDSSTLGVWSPDGCKLLLAVYSVNSPEFFTLTITDLIIENLPSIGAPIWSFDGQSLTFISIPDANGRTFMYSMNLEEQAPHLIWSSDEPVRAVRWLSEDELLYISDGYRYIWNRTTGQSTNFGTDHYPRYARPSELSSLLYSEYLSPDQEMLARFYDLDEYHFMHDERYSDATDEELAEIDAIPQIAGFDIHFLNEGTVRHVDIYGAFLESLRWSPSGRYIAISTYYTAEGMADGIYIYNIDEDTLQRVGDVYRDMGYRAYIPTWSPDEEWLAFNTSAGYVIHRLSDGERVAVDEQMNGSQLWWSPVLDYSEAQCTS